MLLHLKNQTLFQYYNCLELFLMMNFLTNENLRSFILLKLSKGKELK